MRRFFLQTACLLYLVTFFMPAKTWGEETWPRFRGPDADGVAEDDPRLPVTWSTTENVAWAADVPGWGWACPIVWGDRVFLSTVVADEPGVEPSKGLYLGKGVRDPAPGVHHWLVYCFDLDSGEERWKKVAHSGEPVVPRHPKSTYAAETPVTDGERVYVLFGDLGLYAYDYDGNLVWSHDIEPQQTFMDYGAAASPVVHEGQVIYQYDNQEDSYLMSLDAKTGKERWRTTRDEPSTWATPFIWENDVRTEIVTCGKNKIRSYDLEGQLLWEMDGRMSNLVIPSPFAAHGLLYIASGYVGDSHRPVYAIKPGASGEIQAGDDPADSPSIAWYQPRAAPYNPSPIVYGDYYYTLYDLGFLTCHNAKDGAQVYGKKRFAPGASFTASPWAYNDRLFFLSEEGDTYIVKAGAEYEQVGVNSLDELCLSTPAICQGKLLIRTATKLYCITNQVAE